MIILPGRRRAEVNTLSHVLRSGSGRRHVPERSEWYVAGEACRQTERFAIPKTVG